MLEFTQKLIRIRNEHPALRRRKFFQGRSIHGSHVHDVEWYRPDGQEMSDQEWNAAVVRCLGMKLNGQVMNEWDERGNLIHDDILLLLLNASDDDIAFVLPNGVSQDPWETLLDTDDIEGKSRAPSAPGQTYALCGRSLALLRQVIDT